MASASASTPASPSPLATAHARQQRLTALAEAWQVAPLPDPLPIVRPLQPHSVRTPNDDLAAEELLKRQRFVQANDGRPQQRPLSLSRAFTTKRREKLWEPREIFTALNSHVDKRGSPGVAEALIAKLVSVGGDVNVANTRTKTNLLTRRRSVESFERSRILQRAIEHRDSQLVAILVPHADPFTLDASVPAAILSGRVDLVEHLLRYGASTANTAAGLDAFRRVCSLGGQPEMVGLLLASDGHPPPETIAPAMADAAARGCLDTVRHLSRAAANGSFDHAAALRTAIATSRVDIALAVLTGTQPPTPELVSSTFSSLFQNSSILPNDKMALAEILLCAGAYGDPVALAVNQACLGNFSEMVSLLVSYGASVQHDNAIAVRRAIAQKQLSLAAILLADGVALHPQQASVCVSAFPHKQMTNEERRVLLDALLRKGAGGTALSDCLIEAVEAGDVDSARLLLTPYFPGNRGTTAKEGTHHMAAVEYKNGISLQLAVQTVNFDIVDLMLATRPEPEILAEVFPNIFHLPAASQYLMFERFLATGFSGPSVNAALQRALQEQSQIKDLRLVSLFLRSKADVNYGGGAGILSAVTCQDVDLLHTMLQNSQPAVQAVASAIPAAMAIGDPSIRLQMVQCLLTANAGQEGKAVAEALVQTLSTNALDGELFSLLLHMGLADVNYATPSGSPLTLAVLHPDMAVLPAVLNTKRATQESLGQALHALAGMPSTDAKAEKLALLLQYTNDKVALAHMLVSEVEIVVKSPARLRSHSVIQMLLHAHADVNAQKAAALCYAVAAPDTRIVELLLSYGPNESSLAAAISRIFYISDPMDRLSLAQMLLEAGVPASQASHELKHAVETIPEDIPLIKTLAAFSDAEDAQGLLAAVQRQRSEIVTMLLTSLQFSVPALNSALMEAMAVTNRCSRQTICGLLTKAGATGTAVSDALLSAAQEADVGLSRALLANGATVEHQDGQPLVHACRSGDRATVQVLLDSLAASDAAVKDAIHARAFQEAGKLANLAARTTLFRLLLDSGVRGEAINKELNAAVSCGDDGIPLVRLLLEFGADPNHANGEVIWTSTRNAFMATLKLLLGLESAEEDQSKSSTSSSPQLRPSQESLLRALKASWMLSAENRFQVVQWLFAAGLQTTEAVHMALDKAVKDERQNVEQNIDLIRLLLDNGASPLENGCQGLVDAAWRCLVPVMELYMTLDICQADLDYTFAQAIAQEDSARWLSDDGFSVAKMLLEKGARGDDSLSIALMVAIRGCETEKDSVSRQFVQVFVEYGANVDFERGKPLQEAAKIGDEKLVQILLAKKPDADSVLMAFPYIFDSERREDEAVALIRTFNEYRMDGDDSINGIDVMFNHPDSVPVMFRAILQYPRSVTILEALLDTGYYYDQTIVAQVEPELGEESVTLLFWALLQPQKKISSAVIEALIQRGCNVNFETRKSMKTPLMLAIQNKRQDLVFSLISAGACVDVYDFAGNTPLYMAVRAGGEVGLAMMASVLVAEPSRNDGSLHMAARDLNTEAIKMLVLKGHEVDFPSDLHDGRSALAEICLHGSDGREFTANTKRKMEHAMTYLLDQGSDVTVRSNGKTPLLLALEAEDPVTTTQILLKAGMHKYVNKPFNRYNDGKFTYSPTMYVARVLYPVTVSGTSSYEMPADSLREKLLGLLKRSRTEDVFYALDPGEDGQPAGAVGMPEDMQRSERERVARAQRRAAEEEEQQRARRNAQELAELAERTQKEALARERAAILARAQAHAEAARMREMSEAEAHAEAVRLRSRAETEAQGEALQALILRQEMEQLAFRKQEQLKSEQQLHLEGQRHQLMLTQDRERDTVRLATAKELSRVVLEEQRAVDRLNEAQNRRERARLEEGRRLANAIQQMPRGYGQVGNRNVAGYIMGELN